jgi:hypothetical protein
MAFDVSANIHVVNSELNLLVDNDNFRYMLRGIIYYGLNHFTARIITAAGQVWFHDGITTGSSLEYDGTILTMLPQNLMHCRSKAAAVAIYSVVGNRFE